MGDYAEESVWTASHGCPHRSRCAEWREAHRVRLEQHDMVAHADLVVGFNAADPGEAIFVVHITNELHSYTSATLHSQPLRLSRRAALDGSQSGTSTSAPVLPFAALSRGTSRVPSRI